MRVAFSPTVVILGSSSFYEKYFPGQNHVNLYLNETNS